MKTMLGRRTGVWAIAVPLAAETAAVETSRSRRLIGGISFAHAVVAGWYGMSISINSLTKL